MKRYVLLEYKSLKKKVIIDRKEMPTIELSNDDIILNQSDNLLDLLEVGDCVEFNDKEIYSIVNKSELSAFVRGVMTIAIWKRNGDIMRRYEV